VASISRFLLIRHKSLPLVSDLFLDRGGGRGGYRGEGKYEYECNDECDSLPLPVPPGCKPLGRHISRDGPIKTRYSHVSDVASRIREDWTNGALGPSKGYYITGKLDSRMYRDDCHFDGPDPDMPVRGLRKYLNAASSLFDPRFSDAELISLSHDETGGECGCGTIVASWRLGGVINLPWHPKVEPWTGKTTYHLDREGLIYLHRETWDISVWRAFVCTLIPSANRWRIWDARGGGVAA
jgi:hypothetical protein